MSKVRIFTQKPVIRKIVVGTPIRKVFSVVGKNNLNEMDDVNTDNLQDKGVLVWSETAQEWIAQPTLDGQIIEGGDF